MSLTVRIRSVVCLSSSKDYIYSKQIRLTALRIPVGSCCPGEGGNGVEMYLSNSMWMIGASVKLFKYE